MKWYFSGFNFTIPSLSGFTAQPGGYRNFDGVFLELKVESLFWVGDIIPNSRPNYISLNYGRNSIVKGDNNFTAGKSIRCLKEN